jgi:hypothetical protein
MIGLGCKEAVNFDGGGSSMFWCNGRIVNSPCDKREREIANALIVLRKPGEPGGQRMTNAQVPIPIMERRPSASAAATITKEVSTDR